MVLTIQTVVALPVYEYDVTQYGCFSGGGDREGGEQYILQSSWAVPVQVKRIHHCHLSRSTDVSQRTLEAEEDVC